MLNDEPMVRLLVGIQPRVGVMLPISDTLPIAAYLVRQTLHYFKPLAIDSAKINILQDIYVVKKNHKQTIHLKTLYGLTLPLTVSPYERVFMAPYGSRIHSHSVSRSGPATLTLLPLHAWKPFGLRWLRLK